MQANSKALLIYAFKIYLIICHWYTDCLIQHVRGSAHKAFRLNLYFNSEYVIHCQGYQYMSTQNNQLVIKVTGIVVFFIFNTTQAQLVSIGTTAGGANAQIGTSIASIVSSNSSIRMRPQKASGSQQVLEMVNRRRAQFGVANIMQYDMAVNATGLSKDQPRLENIKLAATLMSFMNGIIVRKNSNIRKIADLKNKRVPVGYLSSPLFTIFWKAYMANGGLTNSDISGVPVASLPKSWDAFKEGQVDAVIVAAGAAAVREMAAIIPGGIQYLPIIRTNELLKTLPKTRIEKIVPDKNLDGINEPIDMHVYEYVLFTNVDVNNKTVGEIVKRIYKNNTSLTAITSLWKTFEPKKISMNHDLNYHDGAIEYYKSINIWPE